MKLERHPLSAAWPDMAREDFDALVASIDRNGLRDPIIIFDGQILDGWHRYQACEAVGVAAQTTEFHGDVVAAEQLVCDKHTRRTLTATQRATAVLAMMTWRTGAGRPKVNSVSDTEINNRLPDSRLNQTVAEIAQKAGVSVGTVKKAKEAIAVAPQREGEMRNGNVSASTVMREAAAQKAPQPKAAPEKDWKAEYDKLFEDFSEAQTLLEAYDSIDTFGVEAVKIEIAKRKAVETSRNEAQTALNAQNKTVAYWKKRCDKAEAELGRQMEVAEAEF